MKLFRYSLGFLISINLLAQPVTVAVLDFETSGQLSKDLGRSVAELIRTEFAATGKYSVVERGQLEKVLGEQRFAQAGVVDEQTAAEIGELLGAKYVVIGSVVRFGTGLRGVYTINVRFIDVSTGRVELAKTVKCTSEEEIPDACHRLVVELTGGKVTSTEAAGEKPPVTEAEYKETQLGEAKLSSLEVCKLAHLDARKNVNSCLWFGAGFLLGGLGVLVAYIYEPSTPAYRLLDKSPEYVAYYTECYTKTAKKIQTKNAWLGCITWSVLYGCCVLSSMGQ